MPLQYPSTQAPAAASFGRACADLARQHPLKVMAIVGGAFFCAGLAASLSVGAVATSPAVIASGASPARPPVPAPAPSSEATAGATDDSNAPNCDKQTWPYLDRPCLDALAAKTKQNPQVRVVSTDREAPAAVEGGAAAQARTAATPARQERADAALTPIVPAPAALVVATDTSRPAEPEPDARIPVVAAREEPLATPPSTEGTASIEAKAAEAKLSQSKSSEAKPSEVRPAEAKPKPAAGGTAVAIPAATAGETARLEPPAAPAKAKKKARPQRATSQNKSGDTMLVRDTYTYPDGRQVSITRRVKKDDRFRGEPEEDEAEAPARGGATVLSMPLNSVD